MIPGIPKKPTIADVSKLIGIPSPTKLSTQSTIKPTTALIKNVTINFADLNTNFANNSTIANAIIKPKIELISNI